ncbi:MAG: pyrroloquinoline quinone precursor peptide PqqA [Candidatus Thiodiazotropha endolucinida]
MHFLRLAKINRSDTYMNWSTPSYQDLRFGFEINLYINNR